MNIADVVNDDATLISRRAWSDPEIYELEKRGIFGKAWLFLAHESQIRESGDFVQAYMGETPIIVSRGPDGAVYANINSCSHRGTAGLSVRSRQYDEIRLPLSQLEL